MPLENSGQSNMKPTSTGLIPGITIEAIARAILAYEDLRASALTLEWLRYDQPFAEIARPETDEPQLLAVAAAVVELLAQRANQAPPAWTAEVGGLTEPFFVWRLSPQQTYTRQLCLEESPEPLKRRNIFSPPNYLTFA